MPTPLSVASCQMSHTKTSHRLPIALASPACRCKASWGGTRGTIRRCARSCGAKSPRHFGQDDGVLVGDPSGFPTSGRESVGVARQWCGRLGTVDNCQVAMDLGSGSRKGRTLVDSRLSLPKAWTKETARLDKAGAPTTSRASRTRHQLVVAMLADHSAATPPPMECWRGTTWGVRPGSVVA